MEEFSDHLAMLIDRGGYIMVPLLSLSVISLALIIERIWFWSMTHRPGRLRNLARVNDSLRQGRRDVVKALVENDRSPYGRLTAELVKHGPSDAVAVEVVEAQRPRLDRFMVSLSTIITAAPLLGILGTVIGIIQSFNLLGEQATLTDPREVAGGIAAALLTTALGLIVALMTLFPFMVFRAHVDRSLGRMESVIAAAQQGIQGIQGGNDASARRASGADEERSRGDAKSPDERRSTGGQLDPKAGQTTDPVREEVGAAGGSGQGRSK